MSPTSTSQARAEVCLGVEVSPIFALSVGVECCHVVWGTFNRRRSSNGAPTRITHSEVVPSANLTANTPNKSIRVVVLVQ